MPRDRRSSPNRSALGYWVPLVMTVTVATIGIAAWVWKERSDSDDEDYQYRRDDYPPPAPDYASQPPAGHTGYAPGVEPNAPPPPGSTAVSTGEDPNILARVHGALRRTPSPQQIFDGAREKVVAGVAAAGAMVGGALSSIREEGAGHYEDHSRWSEEAEARRRERSPQRLAGGGSASAPAVPTLQRPGGYRRTVAIVISADAASVEAEPVGFHTEHASILSHLPEHVDNDVRLFILIYSPSLKQHPLTNPKPAPSVASSYSHIGQEDLHTPGEEVERPLTSLDPAPIGSGVGIASSPALHAEGSTEMFKALYQQALALTSQETMIMPFTTPTGWVQMVRHVHPDIVYVQGSLSGSGGESIKEVQRWVGQSVLVVGDDSGHGGLVDSEDEHGPHAGARDIWWQKDSAVGLGTGIEVVEGMRIGEDWRRRVKGHD